MLELSRFALVIGQAQKIKLLRVDRGSELLALVGALLRDAEKSHADAGRTLMGFIHKGGHLVVRDARLFRNGPDRLRQRDKEFMSIEEAVQSLLLCGWHRIGPWSLPVF